MMMLAGLLSKACTHLREAHPILSKEGTRAMTRGGGAQGHRVLATSLGAPALATREDWPRRLRAVPPAVLTWGSVSRRVCGDGQPLLMGTACPRA